VLTLTQHLLKDDKLPNFVNKCWAIVTPESKRLYIGEAIVYITKIPSIPP